MQKIKNCYKYQKGALNYPLIQTGVKLTFYRRYQKFGGPSYRFFQTNFKAWFFKKSIRNFNWMEIRLFFFFTKV